MRHAGCSQPSVYKMMPIKIAFFDIDGTLHHGETLWEILHKKCGTWHTLGIRYWEDFLAGRIDYATFARLDVKAWEGLSESQFREALHEVTVFTEAIQIFNALRENETLIYLISNGIAQLAEHLVTLYGLTGYVANPVHIKDGVLTGEITLTLPYHGKGSEVRRLLMEHNIDSRNALAVGDGPGDLCMLDEVGHPIYLAYDKVHPPEYSGFLARSWKDIVNYVIYS